MFEENPCVSVCIPTFNRCDFLKESIESVLTQTFEDYELLISDNASTDMTEELVRSYRDKRIRYSRNLNNIGVRNNMNNCLALSRGKYITILPDDDVMMPENLTKKVHVLNREKRVG